MVFDYGAAERQARRRENLGRLGLKRITVDLPLHTIAQMDEVRRLGPDGLLTRAEVIEEAIRRLYVEVFPPVPEPEPEPEYGERWPD